MSIIETYLSSYEERGESHSVALAELNQDLKSNYRLNRLYEWRSGSRPIPVAVYRYLMQQVLEETIKRHGGQAPWELEDQDALVAALLPPERSESK